MELVLIVIKLNTYYNNNNDFVFLRTLAVQVRQAVRALTLQMKQQSNAQQWVS